LSKIQFQYGDAVRVRDVAAQQFRPGALASVCGWRDELNADANQIDRLYLIEFGDGVSIEVTESLLQSADSTEPLI
jgi:hypothetical protein